MDHQDFSSPSFLLANGKTNPRQEKGTIKVDMYILQEELCINIFAHRAILSKLGVSDEARQAYLTSTEKQDEELVKKTGRDLDTIKDMAERKAIVYLSKQKDQQLFQHMKTSLTEMLATVGILEKTVVGPEDYGGDFDQEDAGNGIGTPGSCRATRHGRGTKRKQVEKELWRHASEFQETVKAARDEQRQS